MEILNFIYAGQTVEFELSNSEVMVNATEMAKIFSKDVPDFMILKQTKEFVKECLKNQNSGFLGIKNEDDLFTSRQKSGTWMHRVLALKFAAWLNPAFELWVYITIDRLINGMYKEQRDALIEKLSARQKKLIKKQELLDKYANIPEIAEYFELDEKEREAQKRRLRAFKEQASQLSFEF